MSRAHWEQMIDHVRGCLPEEGCGILGGRGGRVSVVLPVTNELHDSSRFRMAPREQLRAFQALEALGVDMIAFFHSHPAGPSIPSETDRKDFAYPGVLAVLCWPEPGGWQASAFSLENHTVEPVPLVVESA